MGVAGIGHPGDSVAKQTKMAARDPCIRVALYFSIFSNSSGQGFRVSCDPSVSTKSFCGTPGRAWSRRTFRLPQRRRLPIPGLWRTPQARGLIAFTARRASADFASRYSFPVRIFFLLTLAAIGRAKTFTPHSSLPAMRLKSASRTDFRLATCARSDFSLRNSIPKRAGRTSAA